MKLHDLSCLWPVPSIKRGRNNTVFGQFDGIYRPPRRLNLLIWQSGRQTDRQTDRTDCFSPSACTWGNEVPYQGHQYPSTLTLMYLRSPFHPSLLRTLDLWMVTNLNASIMETNSTAHNGLGIEWHAC